MAKPPNNPLDFLKAAREHFAGLDPELSVVLWYALLAVEDPDGDIAVTPYALALEIMDMVIGSDCCHWEGSHEDGLKFFDLAIEYATAQSAPL